MLVGLGAATFLVLRGDGRDGFWAGHPMLGALVSGAFLVVVGVVVVDRYISHRSARRWHTVSIAADRELGHLIDETLKFMWTAHSEPDPHGSRRTVVEWTPASRATDVRPGREQLEPASRRLAAFRADLPEPDYTGVTLTPVDRLETLLHDEDFVRFARDLVARCRDEVRESVKGWAALMMWAEQSQRLLNYLSVFAEVHLPTSSTSWPGGRPRTPTSTRGRRPICCCWPMSRHASCSTPSGGRARRTGWHFRRRSSISCSPGPSARPTVSAGGGPRRTAH